MEKTEILTIMNISSFNFTSQAYWYAPGVLLWEYSDSFEGCALR